jgi:hypothetical protein
MARKAPWLLLIHQIPPKPAYLRVKVWRRLQEIGAVAIKNSVWALPARDEAHEDFRWLLREIAAGGGDGSICEAGFIEGLADEDVRALFDKARDVDYAALTEEARGLATEENPDRPAVAKLRRRLEAIAAIDFFGATGREVAEGLIAGLEKHEEPSMTEILPKGRVWVTREGVKVDRIASAWLVRRFIDPKARFKFVRPGGYKPGRNEVRFDMFEAEYTHEGDRCTFEVLLARSGLDDKALAAVAEIVHDLDIKDHRYGRAETAGVGVLLAGIAGGGRGDEERLERGAALFDDLYAALRR